MWGDMDPVTGKRKIALPDNIKEYQYCRVDMKEFGRTEAPHIPGSLVLNYKKNTLL